MKLNHLLLLLVVAAIVSAQEFQSDKEKDQCVRLCQGVVNNCLEPAGSSCQKAYQYC